MLIDRTIADLCVALYAGDALAFDHVDPGTDDGVCWGLKRLDVADVVVLRGSVTGLDWLHDGETRAVALASAPALGLVHSGFGHGMEVMFRDVLPLLRESAPIWIGGHSLGAARASLLTGLFAAAGAAPDASVRFGEPCPGFAALAGVLDRAGLYQASYRNAGAWGHDYVTDVPLKLPDFPYVHPVALTDVDQAPDRAVVARLGLFAGHHMPLYAAAMAARGQA